MMTVLNDAKMIRIMSRMSYEAMVLRKGFGRFAFGMLVLYVYRLLHHAQYI